MPDRREVGSAKPDGASVIALRTGAGVVQIHAGDREIDQPAGSWALHRATEKLQYHAHWARMRDN